MVYSLWILLLLRSSFAAAPGKPRTRVPGPVFSTLALLAHSRNADPRVTIPQLHRPASSPRVASPPRGMSSLIFSTTSLHKFSLFVSSHFPLSSTIPPFLQYCTHSLVDPLLYTYRNPKPLFTTKHVPTQHNNLHHADHQIGRAHV